MSDHVDLVISKTLNCTPDAAFLAWTTPKLLMRFFAPHPAQMIEAQIDAVPGGRFYTKMMTETSGPRESEACILHVVHGRRLVWTDALSTGWRPNTSGLLTADLTFTPNGRTRCDYRVIARHASPEAARKHLKMGFERDWLQVADQLVEVAAEL